MISKENPANTLPIGMVEIDLARSEGNPEHLQMILNDQIEQGVGEEHVDRRRRAIKRFRENQKVLKRT